MTPTVTESWARIEKWLAAHAPTTYAALAPPAEPSAIAEAEQALGLAFPAPLAESLLRHDGTGYVDLLPPFWWLLGTAAIVDEWQLMTRIDSEENGADEEEDGDAEELDAEDELGPWWHREWIPFAADGCGDLLVIDQRAGRLRGRIGDADHEQGCHFQSSPMWQSLPALFAATATSLETGKPVESYEPFVNEEGELDWDIL